MDWVSWIVTGCLVWGFLLGLSLGLMVGYGMLAAEARKSLAFLGALERAQRELSGFSEPAE